MAKTAGRFYEIRKQLGDKPYVLTEDISIPPMPLAAREQWRKISAESVTARYLQSVALADGKKPATVDYTSRVERALIGDQYEACKALFADDARAWDIFITELLEFNKVAGTTSESGDADSEGNDDGDATPA
ncbi:hypothetical protein [Mycolicibacter arupensis]|jgi:hypothetical protein|uniref:Tail assembly chaperone n=1 Tax=Mycolicibacter arupensis TaxID=342002 RepID=A0A0F5MXI0_9MYCO|nr:hypothetical protein [Mycolicibacter arupensis]KKB99475.1 hypothetical protein WR43_09690 [Mycolicibacter arupensis]MCV7277094.1 hypothetical protein [Mycolicibacter arupensis]OQZ93677.1 hypothetical protein BST15_17550 [Mycolicibacter arupensis]TXI54438.1 MAG: hypothetical protein E6Q54_14645 [Mycolicibacter arupensis]